jgi:hypothetical protein
MMFSLPRRNRKPFENRTNRRSRTLRSTPHPERLEDRSLLSGASFSFTSFDPPGSTYTQAWAINDAGRIVGLEVDSSGAHGYQKDGANYTTIDYPGTVGSTYAFGNNSNDQIVGIWVDFRAHAYVKDGSSFTTLNYGSRDYAWGINDSGQIIGDYFDGTDHGFEVNADGSNFTSFDYPGEQNTEATGINNAGQVVGVYRDAGSQFHGYLKDGSNFTTIDYPGAINSRAIRINNTGEILGQYTDASGDHGYLKVGSNFLSIDYPGATGTYPNGINDSGQIVGYYLDATGSHGFVATLGGDVTAPTTTAMLAGPAGNNGWYTGAVTVTLSADDPDDSPSSLTTSYTIDGGPAQTYSAPFVVSGDGAHVVTYYSVDPAGNTEATQSQTIGIDHTAPALSLTASQTTLWPPNGKMVPVTISGDVSDSLSGINLADATYTVIDSYGQVQPSGVITVNADGTFTFQVLLEASRQGQDKQGRVYTIIVADQDLAGNLGTATITLIVAHDQR